MSDPIEIDAVGLRCPLPVLRLQRAMRGAGPGAVFVLHASDPMAAVDVPHFCAEGGHVFLGATPAPDDPEVTAYRVQVAPSA